MPVRRKTRPALAVVAAALVLCPTLPALADPGSPTPTDIARAHQAVGDAKASVQSLQVRAEAATEAYNGALTRAHAAQVVSDRATAASQEAARAQASAQGVAAGARAAATAAATTARSALEDQAAAEEQAQAQQHQLDAIAIGAYEGPGKLAVLSTLLTAPDPSSLARGQAYVNRVGVYQKSVVDDMTRARDRATTAAQLAAAASAEAAVADSAAQQALANAAVASSRAASARATADRAAAGASHALFLASRAKGHALYLVARAQAQLGSAKQQARHLEQAAAAARAAAAHASSGVAPSDAAKTAISWAFQEIGVPYSWGGGDANGPTYGFAQGAGTKGFDCSGLTLFAYAHAGISLDHYTGSQWNQGRRVSSRGDLQPGDLMFFASDTSDPSTIHHMSLYIGNGKMIEAPHTGEVVRVTSYDRSDFIGGVRPWA